MRRSLLVLPALALLALPATAGPRARAMRAYVHDLEARIAALEAVLAYVHVEQGEVNDLAGPHWIVEGANVHVRSGFGTTEETGCFPNCPDLTGLGNLIVGYNEPPDEYGESRFGDPIARGGSHNLVVGPRHAYASFGGLVAGLENTVSGVHAAVCGGELNTASGRSASVSGGELNTARGYQSSVSGGRINLAEGYQTSVSGGFGNLAGGEGGATVSGGSGNGASGIFAVVSGGMDNRAGGFGSTVGGGQGITAIQATWNAAYCPGDPPLVDQDNFLGTCSGP